MDILCFSTTDWEEIWGSRQQIMLRLAAAGNRVLFVERQVSLEHLVRDPELLKRKITRWRGDWLKQITNNVWAWCPPLLLPGRYYSMQLNHLGQRLLASRVRAVIHNLQFNQPILWLYPPHSAPLLDQMAECCSIYHCIDRFAGTQKGIKRYIIEKQERRLIQNVDLVFTASDGLRKKYTHLTRHPITLIPSAADVRYYQSITTVHPQISQIPHPHIGIMGTFDARIDVSLLKNLVANHPEWHFIFLGQIRPGRTKLRMMINYPNAHFIGAHPIQELPSLLNGFDVFLIAYQQNELTEYISPLKLYEYLAVGKPIVSVALPEISAFSQYVYLARPGEFADCIFQALKSDTPAQQQARREVARLHTWDIRVQAMVKTINQYLGEIRL